MAKNETPTTENSVDNTHPILGENVPQHYPPAVEVGDTTQHSVHVPSVTPDEFDGKPNPVNARTTDSEYIVRAGSADEAKDLWEGSRSKLPQEVQDVQAAEAEARTLDADELRREANGTESKKARRGSEDTK